MESMLVQTAGTPEQGPPRAAHPRLDGVVAAMRGKMLSYAPAEPHLGFQRLLAVKGICNAFRQILTQQLGGEVAKCGTVDARDDG